jgi:glycine dehydrogenase subunit 2
MERKDLPLIFERGRAGRIGTAPPRSDVPHRPIEELVGGENVREPAELPQVDEMDLIRHFTNLSQRNYGIDNGLYPLGSCTMKYNPRVNESAAALPGFTGLHPLQPQSTAQGALRLIGELQRHMAEISGFAVATLQPAAGAAGEQLCLMLIKKYHEERGQAEQRKVVLIPDSAHGTNPASAARTGYKVRAVATDAKGNTDLQSLKEALGDDVAGMMLTNPNTLGLFDCNIVEACDLIHKAGGLVFCDGANMNALVGIARPGDMGFDCMHLNLHKTFSTPHGGGGPGGGMICAQAGLEPYLPTPLVEEAEGGWRLNHDRPSAVGRVHGFYGNFLVAARALTYVLSCGCDGLPDVAKHAVLNANYVRARLKDVYPAAYDRICMHECVLTGDPLRSETAVRVLDVSKRLIDYGFHPMTNYFPLIVHEAMMIEPPETENKETLDRFCDALLSIAWEAKRDPDVLHTAPHTAVVGRLDEATAARNLDLAWKPQRSAASE